MATGAPAAAALSSKFKVEAYVYTMVRKVAEAAEEEAEAAEEIKATVWLGLDQPTGQSMISWWRSGDPTPWHGGWKRNPLPGTRSLLVEFNCRGPHTPEGSPLPLHKAVLFQVPGPNTKARTRYEGRDYLQRRVSMEYCATYQYAGEQLDSLDGDWVPI